MKFANHYAPPLDKGVVFEGESLTQQEYKADCDVNTMIRRAIAGDSTVFRHPVYMDVLNAPDSGMDVANRLADARTIWHDMPDNVRATYGSPEALLAAIDRQIEAEKAPAQKPVEKKPVENKSVAEPATSTSTVEPAPFST